jgi:HSP20 family molecular chaperone IbpA
MHPELIEMMRDQVCTIYRAATGTDIPAAKLATSDSEPEPSLVEITRSFAELEALTRVNPALAGKVPPFSFVPSLDVFRDGDDLLIEVAVPGVERQDITVECADGMLVISGIRRGHSGSSEQTCSGEIPYGPFYRALPISLPIKGEPAVDLDRGLLRVRLTESSTNKHTQEVTLSSSQTQS